MGFEEGGTSQGSELVYTQVAVLPVLSLVPTLVKGVQEVGKFENSGK